MAKSIIMFIGGIALFIYSITILSDYLKKSAGNKFKAVIEKVIDNPYLAVLVAMLITLITNSSSVVIVLVISLVRAGIMSSRQSVGLIIGMNIGSTFAAFIVSLPIGDYAYLLLVLGLILIFFKNAKFKNIGGVILSLGLLFVGLNIMSAGVLPLIETPLANKMFLSFSKETFGGSFLGFIFGTFFTAVVQSSAATNAIVQKLYSFNSVSPTISLRGALPMVIGANIGTTITGILATIGGNEDSKRTAFIHTTFNIFGGLLFLVLVVPFTKVMQVIENSMLAPYSMFTIAIAHLIQNVVTGIIVFVFAKQLVKLAELVVPVKEEKVLLVFDEGIIDKTPDVALSSAKMAIDHLTKVTYDYFNFTKDYTFNQNANAVAPADEFEEIIDELDGKIHTYLIKIMRKGINYEALDLTKLLDITRDLERIGDHLTNIVEFLQYLHNEKHEFTKAALNELNQLYATLDEMLLLVIDSINSNFKKLPKAVLKLEEQIDLLEEEARNNYLKRLKDGEVNYYQTASYTDVLSDLERIGDHLHNIASTIIDPMPEHVLVTGLKKKVRGN